MLDLTMHLSCDCLNVLINSKNANFSLVDPSLRDSFTNDTFFTEDIGLLSLCSINVQVPSIVKERETGEWRIVKCLNCGKSCYAIKKSIGMGTIVVCKDLEIDTNKINRLKQSDLYSPIFKILIYNNDLSSDDETEQKMSLYPPAVSWLNEQTALTEEKVKLFSDKEYGALEEMRKRAYKEQRLIKRREFECAKEVIKTEPVDELGRRLRRTLSTPKTRKVLKKSSESSSFDAEGVFLLDGFESESGNTRHEDSDTDGSEDSASFQPRRMGAAQLAKSLPIPVPFMEDAHQNDPIMGSPPAPTDIAASIKALAKSVHGDAVFGELPPPRFSTKL